jgi:hypothetical protein
MDRAQQQAPLFLADATSEHHVCHIFEKINVGFIGIDILNLLEKLQKPLVVCVSYTLSRICECMGFAIYLPGLV